MRHFPPILSVFVFEGNEKTFSLYCCSSSDDIDKKKMYIYNTFSFPQLPGICFVCVYSSSLHIERVYFFCFCLMSGGATSVDTSMCVLNVAVKLSGRIWVWAIIMRQPDCRPTLYMVRFVCLCRVSLF